MAVSKFMGNESRLNDMRLTCPNCKAQYEVEATVIPDGGRDVQCSSCGITWLQMPQTPGPATSTDLDDDLLTDPDPDDSRAIEDHPEPEPATPELSAIATASAAMRRRTLDDAVASVLREEAERETSARQAEGSLLETQQDLGLTEASPAIPAPPPQTEDHADAAMISRQARRELLPDIEAINSTLRATSERDGDAAAMDAPETLRQRRSGFRKGFLSSVAVMALLMLPYLLAEEISARVPALSPVLGGYASAVDTLRTWLDHQMVSTTDALRGDQAAGS